jgi:CrcB protein
MPASLWVILGIVALGGAIGALVRHAAATFTTPDPGLVRRRITAINVVGAFCAGAVMTIDHALALAITVGLFGSLTTFSTIAVWVAQDFQHREPVSAIKVLLGHVLLGVPAVLGGFLLAQIVL